jgi:SLT domain-containing protein
MKAKTTNSSSSFVSLTSMSGHATGAVFDHDQLARVGEGGEPEYLLPESKLGAFAAMAINGTRPGSTPSSGALPPIYIMVDKRILGQVVDEAIGRNMSLNGARIS